jgi:tRNA pseudouridine55 synthase
VKRKIGGGKTGHAGTLDPFAEGVLLVCTGHATKKIGELVDAPKEYRGRIRLGIETDTLDMSGSVVDRMACRICDPDQVRRAVDKFVGEVDQVPPLFSALHIAGHRAYRLARSGAEISPEPRRVTIYSMDIVQIAPDLIDFSVTCSKGTYIRALARDLARELGTVGFLSHLTRTRIGDYALSDALEVTALSAHLGL